jgi:hypothetical protein
MCLPSPWGQQNLPCGPANYSHQGGPLGQTEDVTAPPPLGELGSLLLAQRALGRQVSLGKWPRAGAPKPWGTACPALFSMSLGR